jgi:hypothetical protein
MRREYVVRRLTRTLGIFGILAIAAVAISQDAIGHPIEDSTKIADAMRAEPKQIGLIPNEQE